MDANTPIPRTISGKTIHSRRPVACQRARPRIKPETTSTATAGPRPTPDSRIAASRPASSVTLKVPAAPAEAAGLRMTG